jgi:hypothetical protein
VPELVFEDKPSWLVWGRRMITHRNEGLNVPFSKVSSEVWKDLEKEEKTKGRLQWVLTGLKEIGRNVAKKVAERVFESDSNKEEGGPGAEASGKDSESLLECVRHILVTEAAIQRSKLKKKHKANPILQTRNLDLIPPRGVLVTMGVPGEIVPAMDHLWIQEYSNGAYWRFAPYLDSVRHVLESPTPENAVLTSSTRTSKPSLKVCMRLMIKGFIPCGLTVSKSSMGLWRKK